MNGFSRLIKNDNVEIVKELLDYFENYQLGMCFKGSKEQAKLLRRMKVCLKNAIGDYFEPSDEIKEVLRPCYNYHKEVNEDIKEESDE